MYHELTFEEQKRRRLRRMVRLVAVVLLAAICWMGYNRAVEVSRSQGATAVRDSVMRCVLQCCAVEGSYPTSVKHLEDHYGLVINESDYQVIYEWMGDNVMPSVVVRSR